VGSNFGLVSKWLGDSRGLLCVGLLPTEIVRSGDQESKELQCRLLIGLLDMSSVSVSLLLMRLLLSSRLLLWLLSLLEGYSLSDMMIKSLSRDVDSRKANKRVIFITLFPRWLKQTVNLPREGGRPVQPGVRGKGGRDENQKERSHARV
jgi:hypothetical protein